MIELRNILLPTDFSEPSSIAGKYGKAALEKLGVWASVSSKVAPAEDVRSALLLVSRAYVAGN